jgi:hypothetical protein
MLETALLQHAKKARRLKLAFNRLGYSFNIKQTAFVLHAQPFAAFKKLADWLIKSPLPVSFL